MSDFKMKLLNFIGKIANEHWWVWWSNFRWRNSIRNNIGINEEDKVSNLKEIRSLLSRLYSKFNWTDDGLDELFDSIVPPPQNYSNYLNGAVNDDCDGFHSLVSHCLSNNCIECYLLSVNAIKTGHCVLVFKLDGKWHLNDYLRVCKGYDTITECIETYVKEFPLLYDAESEVFYYGLTGYDYETEKFYHKPIEEIE